MTFYQVFLAAWMAMTANAVVTFAVDQMIGESSPQPRQECVVSQ